MSYFLICEDKRERFFYKGFSESDVKKIPKNDTGELTIFSTDKEVGDIIFSRKVMISKKLKDILEQYDSDIFYGEIAVFNKKTKTVSPYFILDPYERKCLKNENVKLIIDPVKCKPFKIFCVKHEKDTKIVVNLEIAERLLREGISGALFEEISE